MHIVDTMMLPLPACLTTWREPYSRGPFMAAVFLLVFWILFSGPWWSRLVAKHSSLWLLNVLLAFVSGCWISWLLSAWTDCLVACIWCRWLFVLDRCRWHTSWIWVGAYRKCIFCWYEHSYNFYPAPNVNLGIDREGTAKSQDGQQKGTLAHVKRKVATALSMKVKPV